MNTLRLEFDHIGIPCDDRHDDETYVEATKVWVTNPRQHPQSLEFLRYEPDSPVVNAVRTRPHVAFRVPMGALEPLLAAADEVLLEPWEAQKGVVRVAFALKDGACIEYMEYMGDPEQWFPHERDGS
ncbi:hypothetical protein [Pseudonocardia acidicola]|uniref:VOC domain-containing protein n=1 Tax=Pseudonocardia acidicola TaxID=2724939 RepID=A0ABX1S944_9PSEU|nr:hypothetical protein [Pseudonocardia acidicola]NMH97397.1 hypothetical protein [Pseudonocardia acidicola]